MHKVSEGKLNLMIESTDLAIAEGQFGVVLCADDVADALAELLDRRAAEREQAAPQAEPTRADALNYAWLASRWRKLSETGAEVGVDLGMQAEREQAAPEPRKLDEVTCTITVNPGAYEAAMAVAGSKIAEFIRAKQPKPRTPAKWERRLDRMSGGLHFNYSGGEGWYASWMIDGGVVKYAYGDTPKAAVEAAWKAWKEECGE